MLQILLHATTKLRLIDESLSVDARVLPLCEGTQEEAHTEDSEFHSRFDRDRSHLSDPHVMQVVPDRLPRIRRNVAFRKRVAR